MFFNSLINILSAFLCYFRDLSKVSVAATLREM